ncbi:MAG: hypothetical protein PQJ46_17355 [Spirochaetales bacterium]|nr:hypothetical protein [Spirochaetales bacterium]
MKKINTFVDKITQPNYKRWIIVGYFLSLTLLLNPWFGTNHLKKINNGMGMIEMHIFNMPSQLHEYLNQLGSAGVHAYMILLIIDVLFLIDIGCLQLTLFNILFKKTSLDKYLNTAIWLVVARVIIDLFENCLMTANLKSCPNHNPILLLITTITTTTKWILLIISLIILFGMLGIFLVKKAQKKT